MSALQSSLSKLDQAVNKLESVIDTRTRAAKSNGQSDLFSAMGATRKSNDNVVDTSLLADKLDSAIAKVEKILNES